MKTITNLPYYQLKIDSQDKECWVVDTWFAPPISNSSLLPSMTTTFDHLLPEIYEAECDNPSNLSFKTEMLQTETAHLFEHILLEYLCKEQLASGKLYADYSGRTFWNANQKIVEKAIILIQKHREHSQLFYQALLKSCLLLDTILATDFDYSSQTERVSSTLSVASLCLKPMPNDYVV